MADVLAHEAESRSLGYAHWPELAGRLEQECEQSRSLGYAHWPELRAGVMRMMEQSRSLGYAHWPEPVCVVISKRV